MRSLFVVWLLLTALAWARPVQSARGLCTFEVPNNLSQSGGTRWGTQPGLIIEMREEFAPKGELKDLILLMSPPTASGKKVTDDSIELEGARGQIIARKEGNSYSKSLFLRHGQYNLGWTVSAMHSSEDEINMMFDLLKESIKFTGDSATLEFSREVRDPSGALEIRLPKDFAGGGRKYSNGEIMVILTPLKEGGDKAMKDFAFQYAPTGYKSYMRRADVEMGEHRGALVLTTSDDELLENQMVMLSGEKTSVVLSFLGPVRLRSKISLIRERVVGEARWTR